MRSPKTVVIVGASSGIGRATALRFASTGANLVLASRRGEALEHLAAECERAGAAAAITVVADVTDNEQVLAIARAALGGFGTIDVWVNGVGVSVFAKFLEVPLDDFRRILDVNIMGTVYGSRAALAVFTRQGFGSLINIASIVGEIPQPYTSSYSMSKSAVRSLGVSLRQELSLDSNRDIHVTTVLPPAIDTPFFRHAANHTGRAVLALPPVYPPVVVAKAIVKAASSHEHEVVVTRSGKTLVRAHRRSPRAVEAQMALLTEKSHLSRTETAPDTTGTIYEPAGTEDATVTGGWHGAAKTARRRVLTWAVVLGLAAVLVRPALRSTR